MEKKKLSIGIDLDTHLKQTIAKNIKEYKDLPVRWHAAESYHIPLLTLGWVQESVMTKLIVDLHEFASQELACDVELREITMTHKSDRDIPQKVQIIGEQSEALRDLYVHLMDLLEIGHAEVKSFTPHVALGHVRAGAWEDLEHAPSIQKDFSVLCDVMAFTLFEEVRDGGKKVFRPIEVFTLS